MGIRVLIIDDHPLFRQGISAVLQQLEGDCVFDEAETWEAAGRILETGVAPDLVLLDLKLPDIDGVDALRLLRKSHPIVPVVILSANDNPATMRNVLDMGALGFLPKSASNEVMVQALQLVMAGGIYVPPEALNPAAPKQQAVNMDMGELVITQRQTEVLDLMVQGHPNKIIAERLGLSENTVRGHVSALFKILGVTNRTEAAYAAAKALKDQ